VTTPGGTTMATAVGGPIPGVGIGKFGPNGTVTYFTFTPMRTKKGFTNMASSVGYPWTTGKIQMSAMALGAPEIFTITGKDSRTAGGVGTIQLVSGALSQRTRTGPNANRGWVRLMLEPVNSVPALSPPMLVVAALVMLFAFGYSVRRFASATR